MKADYLQKAVSVPMGIFSVLFFMSSICTALTISGNNVGIGTNTPAWPLDVVGSINTSGNIVANGTVSGSSCSVSGTVSAGNVSAASATFTGSLSAGSISGNGSGLTNINPATITTGTANIDISGNAATASSAVAVVPGAVTASGLSTAAVTAAKIAFFNSTAIVASSGGHYSDPVTAMANLSSWCSNPCVYPQYNRCLLKIMPGTYDIGSNTLQMHDCVDIEGSGETNTKISGRVDSTTSGVIKGAQAELRSLTVWNDFWQISGGNNAIAIYNDINWFYIKNVAAMSRGAANNYGIYVTNGSVTYMEKVTADARIGTGNAYGIYDNMSILSMKDVEANAEQEPNAYGIYLYTTDNWIPSVDMTRGSARGAGNNMSFGIYNRNLSVNIKDVELVSQNGSVYNYGILNEQSGGYPMTLINISIDASGGQGFGILNASTGGPVTVDHSVIKGSTNTVRNDNAATTFRVGATKLYGTGVASGMLTCVGVYNGNYVSLNAGCQ